MDSYKCPECGRTYCLEELEDAPSPPFSLGHTLAVVFFFTVSAVISITGIWFILSWIF